MNRNFLKHTHYFVLAADLALLFFLHERLVPIMDDLLKNGDDEIVAGITGSEITAAALVFMAFLIQALAWYFLTESEHRLWKHPENMDAGEAIRIVCICALLIIPFLEAGLTAKLFLGEQTNAFAAVRQTSPSTMDTIINSAIAALVGLISTVLAWLTAATIAMRVEQRDEAEAESLFETETPVEPAE